MVRTLMGHVNRPINASTALLASSALSSGGTLPYGTLTRTGAGATYTDGYGTVQSAAANVARINNSQLVGSNLIRNVRFNGATVGITASTISFMTHSVATGLSAIVVGKGVLTSGIAAGMDYVDIRISGDNTSATTLLYQLYPEGSTLIPAVQGDVFTISAYMQVIAGTMPIAGGPLSPGFDERTGGAHVTYNFSNSGIVGNLNTTMQRVSRPTTVTTPGITAVQPGWWFNAPATAVPVDYTIRIAGWQFEKGSVATVVSYPAPGTYEQSANYVQPRLLIEETRTNAIRNPRAEGAVAATPGTSPTNWGGSFNTSGLVQTIVGTGTENGIPYIDYKCTGTATATIFPPIFFETGTIATSVGVKRALSVYMRLVGGSWSGVTALNLGGYELDGASAFLVTNAVTQTFPTVAPLVTQRFTNIVTMGQATVAFWSPQIHVQINIGAVVDFTIRIGAPQDELGATATSLILPPVSVPAATVRGNDIYNIPTTGLLKYGTPVVNLALYSEQIDNGLGWGLSEVTVSGNVSSAPDGAVTADSVIPSIVSAQHQIASGAITFVVGQTYTLSFYAKANGYGFIHARLSGGSFPLGRAATFNLSSGTVNGADPSLVRTSVQPLSGSWYRCSITAVCTVATTSIGIAICINATSFGGSSGAETFSGDGVSGVLLWGVQLETGGSASAYSVTTGTTSTPRTKLAPGTIVTRSRIPATPPTGAVYGIFTLSDGLAANRFGMRYVPGSIGSVLITSNMSNVAPTGMAAIPQPATTYTQATAWDDTSIQSVVNGGFSSTANNVPMPTGVTTLHVGQGASNAFFLVGEIDYITYYPYRMTTAQMIAVTT